MLGGGIEIWFAYVLALVFLLFRPQGLFGEKHHRPGLSEAMLYRENGQFKTTYRADQQIFPILQDRVVDRRCCWRSRSSSCRCVASEYLFRADPDPVPDPVARRARPQHPGRLLRPDLARHRRLHGGRRLRGLQLHGAHRRHAAARGAAARRPVRDAWSACCSASRRLRIKGLYLAVATLAAQFFVDWAFLRVPWFTNDSTSGSVSVAGLSVFGFAIEYAGAASTCSASRSSCVFALLAKNLVRGRHRPRMDGDPRHGRRRRGDRHPAGVRQAHGVRRQLVHRRRRRRAVGLRLPRLVGAGGVLDRPLVPAAVHGHHRRPRLDHGQLLRRRLHRRCCRSC